MSVEAATDAARSPGFIRIDAGGKTDQVGFTVDMTCLANQAYRIQMAECPDDGRYEIAVLENDADRSSGNGASVARLYSHDLERAFSAVEHIINHDDPRKFCGQVALMFGVEDPTAPIPLDCDVVLSVDDVS